MKTTLLSIVFALAAHAITPMTQSWAQLPSTNSAALAEAYGQGVHAYNAGDYIAAYDSLTLAIENGVNDPRANYFRGIVAYRSGRIEEARGDWQAGAAMEASMPPNPSIGKSLSRIQGSMRIELERIRRSARLQATARSVQRSNQRYGELGAKRRAAQAAANGNKRAKMVPPAVPAAAANENPFADDIPGQAKVDNEDPFADAIASASADAEAANEAAAAAAPAGDAVGGNVFGGDAAPGMQDNPFNTDAANPFGASDSPF